MFSESDHKVLSPVDIEYILIVLKEIGIFLKELKIYWIWLSTSESFQKNPISFSTIKMYSIYTELSTLWSLGLSTS